MRCTTRAKKNVVMQQQMINVDEAVQILEQETPPLVVNRNKLKVCWMIAELIFASASVTDHSSALLLYFFRSCWSEW